ncbi:MAG: DUF4350 domain-containing protein [Anaerolineales bacterium]
MKAISRDTRVAVGILILLVIVTVVAALQTQAEQQFPTLSTLSSAPNGALALKLWVQELGYGVDETVLSTFSPPEQASIIFMLEPRQPTEAEMDSIDNWVQSGGTLIAIGEGYEMFSLVEHFKFFFNYQPGNMEAPTTETPLLDSPSSLDLKNVKVNITLGSERNNYVVLSADQGKPVLVSFELGQGRVILGTTAVSFTNEGLKQQGNPELVLNILALARAKGDIWFDEWHHGLQNGTQVSGPAEFLRFTPVGRSLLFVTFAVFIAFFMQGRGFGRPVPLPQEIRRRGALEHVTGIANLNRRAAHRPAVMMYYHNQIKRKLGQRYRLDPAMDDEQYVDTLAGYNPALDKNGLLDLLKRLKRRNVGETEMVHLAVEAAKWIDA